MPSNNDDSDKRATRTVTLQIPEKEPETRKSFHDRDERRTISIPDGPTIAFTESVVRVYDDGWNEFIPLTYRELAELLSDAYTVTELQTNDQ